MKELVEFYRARLKWLVGLIITWLLFVSQVLTPLLTNNLSPDHAGWAVSVGNALSSKLAIVGFFVVGEIAIRTWLWKFQHPELDFEGEWKGENIYTEVQPGGPLKTQKRVEHTLRFDQNCLKFVMKPSTGKAFINWGFHAINLDEQTVKYAYWVNYNDSSFPSKATGYEELKVTKYHRDGRPIELTGWFSHCVNGSQPAYSGSVKFWRAIDTSFLGSRLRWRRRR